VLQPLFRVTREIVIVAPYRPNPMPNTLHSLFLRISTPRTIAALALLTVFLFWLIQVHGIPGIPLFNTVLRIGIPDMMLAYAPATIHEKLTQFGPDGRVAYRLFLERVDFAFPAIYGLFLVTATTFGLWRLFPSRPALQTLSLLTLGTTLFDWTENVFFLILLRKFPDDVPILAKLANVCTLAKWCFAGYSIALLLLATVGLLFPRRAVAPT
jgi:hypothetical protein